jgi:diguanylate cyclase (GGDEF)-like protein/PAS domain S-box-containing protein
MSIVFAIFIAFIWVYSQALNKKINEIWGERYVHKQITFDKYRTLLPILNEIDLVAQLSKEPTIIAMAKNENDPKIRDEGLKTLERYRIKFQDRSYFCAFSNSGNYYFNNSSNQFYDHQLRYVLSPNEAKDRWFYEAIKLKDTCLINVNKDKILGVNKIWVDYILRDNGKVLGVIGTGFDFDQFLKQSVGIEQEGVRNFFIDKDLSIQLAKDTQMIDYASITKKDGTHKTIDMVFKNPNDISQIKDAMAYLSNEAISNSVKTLWVTVNDKKHLLGIAYQPDVGWFSLTLFDTEELNLINDKNIFIFLSLFFMATLFILGFTLKTLVVSPVEKLKALMVRIENGSIDKDLPIIGSGEIAELSNIFNNMVKEIQQHNLTLEQKIIDRTQALQENENKLNLILDNVDAYIYLKDLNSNFLYVNQSIRNLLGKSLDNFIGKNDYDIFDPETAKRLLDNDVLVFQTGEKNISEESITDSSGHITKTLLAIKIPLKREDGTIYALCGISTDITARKQAEEEIRALAFYDTLTHLPNRRLLSDRLLQAQNLSKRSGYYGAVLFMDLDNFKPLNDTYGHTIGDLLLIQVAQRIRSSVRESDTVARFGGDEFIVLLSELSKEMNDAIEQVKIIAEKIRHSLSHPYFLKIHSDTIEERIVEHHCSASIGCTLFLNHDLTQDEIFNQADSAMYTAKESGRNRVHFYTTDL